MNIQIMDSKSIFDVISEGDLEKLKFLVLEKKVDIEVRNYVLATPLLWASRKRNYEMVTFLIENGANTKTKDFLEQDLFDFIHYTRRKEFRELAEYHSLAPKPAKNK